MVSWKKMKGPHFPSIRYVYHNNVYHFVKLVQRGDRDYDVDII